MQGRDKHTEILNQLCDLAQSVATPLGLCVVEVKFGQAGKRRTVEVTIHRRGSAVSLDDCEQVSRALEQLLDEQATADAPLITGPYMLEVQSPGIDRTLKSEREFLAFIGQPVIVQTKEKVQDMGHRILGTLAGSKNGKLILTNAKPFKEGKKVSAATGQGGTKEAGQADNACSSRGDSCNLEVDNSNLVQVRLHSELLSKGDSNN
jgi:ribosome maturation factor RimP